MHAVLFLKPFTCIGKCNRANSRYNHCYSFRKSNQYCRIYLFNRLARNYITCLGQKSKKNIPCPAAHPRVGHIRKCPPDEIQLTRRNDRFITKGGFRKFRKKRPKELSGKFDHNAMLASQGEEAVQPLLNPPIIF